MGQFADDSMTPDPISISRDKYGNEIPTDKPMHDNSTPGVGSWSWDENHYANDPKGGVSVAPPSLSSERITVDNSRADRGMES